MKIEVGKTYITRDGTHLAQVIRIIPESVADTDYPVLTVDTELATGRQEGNMYTREGAAFGYSGEHDADLVAEATDTPIWCANIFVNRNTGEPTLGCATKHGPQEQDDSNTFYRVGHLRVVATKGVTPTVTFVPATK